MSEVQGLRAEVRRLAEQTSSDFQFTMVAMKEMGQSFRQGMESMGREMDERFNQLAGRMKLQEQRVSAVLQAVDSALAVYETAPTQADLEEIRARLDRLEQDRPPAA